MNPKFIEHESFIHALSDVRSTKLGKRSRFWQFVVVLPDAVIGDDCNICAHCFIENDVVIGDRVTVKSGVQLWDGTVVEDDVFIGPNVTFTNDRYPRSRNREAALEKTIIERGASVGGGSVLLPGIRVGKNAMIGAGSVVTKDVPEGAVMVGNPAKIVSMKA
jgi:UDP-2-acetamido-3-amino-2,3-dideoxy-glucuronate N-acetyltransferase